MTDLQREPSPPPPYSPATAPPLPPYDTVTCTSCDGSGAAVTTLAPNEAVFMKRSEAALNQCEDHFINIS